MIGDRVRPALIAARFLTRYPFPDPGPFEPGDLGRALPWYPVVGLLIGVVLAVALWLLGDAPAGLAAALLLTLWVWSTGALHLDGLADTADAWVGGLGSRERTLAIMKDPASGPAAVSALVLVLLVKLAAIGALVGAGASAAALMVPPLLGRAGLPLLFASTPYVRPGGMGAEQAGSADPTACRVAAGLSALAAVLLVGWPGAAAVISAAVLYVLLRRAFVARLGGFTGDTAGALVELTETVALTVLALVLA
jgi:adenosylcobinamide-GDP ribazoletransferase